MTLREVFSSIANAIRSKTGKTATIKPVDMATEIESIQTGGGENKLLQLVDGSITTITANDLAGITKIKDYTFYKCASLTSVILPDNITSMGSSVFFRCTSLISINIPDGVNSIGNNSFQNCSSLISINIPAKVTSIGASALQIGSSTNKATITMKSTTPPSIYLSTFKGDYLNKIIVPVGCGNAYKSATNWSNFADYIEEATA